MVIVHGYILNGGKRERHKVQCVSRYYEYQIQIKDYQLYVSLNSSPESGSFAHPIQVLLLLVVNLVITSYYHNVFLRCMTHATLPKKNDSLNPALLQPNGVISACAKEYSSGCQCFHKKSD